MHFKDIDPVVKSRRDRQGHGLYDALRAGAFSATLGDGDVTSRRLRQSLIDNGFEGWCTVEQDCDPTLPNTDARPCDAKTNRAYLPIYRGFS